jgi:hypothetical protein
MFRRPNLSTTFEVDYNKNSHTQHTRTRKYNLFRYACVCVVCVATRKLGGAFMPLVLVITKGAAKDELVLDRSLIT